MLADKALQSAIICSLIVHTVFFLGLPRTNPRQPPQSKKQLQLTYLKEKASSSLKLSNKTLSKKHQHKIYSKKISPPPYVEKKQIFSSAENMHIAEPKLVKTEIIAVKKKITLPALKDENIINPEYLDYYQRIREKIKQAAYRNYTRLVNGEVYLSFIVFNNGKLKVVKVNQDRSTKHNYLKNIAKKTVFDASPFPGFPEELNYPELSFNVIISFEVE